MSAAWTRCDSDEAFAGIIARWAARGQAPDWQPNPEEGGEYQARLLDEDGRVIEVAFLEVSFAEDLASAPLAAASGSAA